MSLPKLKEDIQEKGNSDERIFLSGPNIRTELFSPNSNTNNFHFFRIKYSNSQIYANIRIFLNIRIKSE